MVVVIDEPTHLSFEVAGQIVVFEQDAVFERLMPTLDLALGLRMAGRATHVPHIVLAAKPIQHDADFLLGRILLARRPANVSHDPLGRQFGGSGFLAHLHSSTVTMSQKSSFPQTLESVSQALTPDT